MVLLHIVSALGSFLLLRFIVGSEKIEYKKFESDHTDIYQQAVKAERGVEGDKVSQNFVSVPDIIVVENLSSWFLPCLFGNFCLLYTP